MSECVTGMQARPQDASMSAASTGPDQRKRILFVDDEQNVLHSIRNLLRKQRHEWDMVFVTSGDEALAELEKAPFEVVISDMRMPKMDGATLLRKVKEHWPSCTRVVLSGYAERAAVIKALPVAHQYLSKPCEPEAIRVVIENTCARQALLANPSIRAIVGGLEKLPSVPHIYRQLIEALANPDASIGDVAEIVRTDPAMSIKVLQIVNFPYFGMEKRQATSVAGAVARLGTDLFRELSRETHTFNAMSDECPAEGFSIEMLQQASLLAARIGGLMFEDARRREDTFTACLVNDVGRIVLALGFPEQYGEVLRRATEGANLHEVEKDMLGVTHSEVGAYLLDSWGLPRPIVDAVAHCHAPETMSSGQFDVMAATHVAHALAAAKFPDLPSVPCATLDADFLDRVGMANHIPEWQALADREALALSISR